MTKFVGSTGLTYLWSKIKAWVQSAFVSNVSISGDKVRVTKNGSNTDLTVPYATKTAQLDRGVIATEDALASEDEIVKVSRIGNDIPQFPTVNNANAILDINVYPGKYNHEFGFSSNGNIYHRYRNGSTFGEWVELVKKDDGLQEAYLKWGGKNLDNAYSPVDAAMINELGADRSAFLNGQHVDIEYSRDDGATWTDYGATNAQKGMLFSNGTVFTIGKPADGTVSDAHCQLRITINTANASFYSKLNKFALYITTSGSSDCWCSIDVKLQQNINNNIDTWVNRCNKASISGWSGWNIINIADTTTYGNQPASQYGQIRFTFGCTRYTGNGTTQQGLGVQKIRSFGGVGWYTPSNMAKNGHLYSWDDYQTMITPASIRPVANNTHMCGNSTYRWSNVYSVLGNFSGAITGNSFVKSGGTSSQFLKADGSVDSTSYAPQSSTYNKTEVDNALNTKQNILVSGTNIKTVNNQPLLGSGNISIEISGEYIAYPSFAINSVGHLIMTDGAEGLFTIENGHLKYNF